MRSPTRLCSTLTMVKRNGRGICDRIRAKGYTDNVVELIVAKLSGLPVETQNRLQQFASIGIYADFHMLTMVCQEPGEGLHELLWPAVRSGLIFRAEHSYRFLHDRVQEAAYSLIPKNQRAPSHLRIGKISWQNILRRTGLKKLFSTSSINSIAALS